MPLIGRWFTAEAMRTTLAALLTGAILHLCTTFVLARVGATQPFANLARDLPVNEMKLLPIATPKTQMLPFEPADVLSAGCAFDATAGPVVVRVTLPGAGWTLSFYSPSGSNFYTIAGQDGRRTDVALLLVPAGDEFVPIPFDPTGQQQRLLQVTLPAKIGVALVRAPLPSQAWRSEVEADLRLASCALRRK